MGHHWRPLKGENEQQGGARGGGGKIVKTDKLESFGMLGTRHVVVKAGCDWLIAIRSRGLMPIEDIDKGNQKI